MSVFHIFKIVQMVPNRVKVTLLNGCFSRFLNFINGTTSRMRVIDYFQAHVHGKIMIDGDKKENLSLFYHSLVVFRDLSQILLLMSREIKRISSLLSPLVDFKENRSYSIRLT